jgi:threonine/homoserine/homoserine lactone efflux protein
MLTETLIKGAIVGFAIAALVGPIGFLCIRRSIVGGFWAGFATGLGAAVADCIFGAIAALGLATAMGWLLAWEPWVRLVGGAVLIFLGVRAYRRPPQHGRDEEAGALALTGAFASTLALTLANPMTILSFIAVFAGIGVGAVAGKEAAATLILGVFLGSAAWWLGLSSTVAAIRHQFSDTTLIWINRLAAVAVVAFGVYVIGLFLGQGPVVPAARTG